MDARATPEQTAEVVALAEERVDHYRHDDFEALDTLADAYASAGRYVDAQRAATRALARALAQQGGVGDPESLRTRLALYRANRPYRGP